MKIHLRRWGAALLVGCLIPASAHADWNQANDEANRQRMMSEMRANAAAADRANEESQRRQQAAYDSQRNSSSSSSGSSSSSSSGGGYTPYQAAPEGPHSVVSTYTFTIHKQESESQTLARIQSEAQAGQVQSQFNLGRIYFTGYGLPHDEAKARQWFGAAADQGHAGAQAQYGIMLYHGQGGPADKERGLAYMQKAAEQGDVHGEAVYGALALKISIDPQPVLVNYLIKAADQGDVVAQNALGRVVYYMGVGAPFDDAKALKYLKLAAAQHDPSSMEDLGVRLLAGQTLPKDEARGLALVKASAEAGFPEAQSQYGFMQIQGLYGVTQDVPGGIRMLRGADESGNPLGTYYLGTMYEFGTGVPKDINTAVSFYKKAAEAGDAEGKARYGINLVQGLGTAKDVPKGAALIQESADMGDDRGEDYLARLYYDGAGVPKDRNKSAHLFKKAAQHGNADAANVLKTDTELAALAAQD